MKSNKSRFLNRFRTIPSKQHAVSVPLCCDSPDRLSNSQNLPNYMQQEHVTKSTCIVLRDEDFKSRLYVGEHHIINTHIMSPCSLEQPTHEIDVFEECESELDTMPEMVSSCSSSSSSSSSSSCSSSPTRETCKSDNDIEVQPYLVTKNLKDFEEKCPPGGSDKVILYTTSLTGIKKTYEDCHAIKFLLESFRVVYLERDVSMHLEYRDEFWRILGGRNIPPRLFIKGRHIGGFNEVATLHELGMLKRLLQGIPVLDSSCDLKCSQCSGVRFLLCLQCNGSCKIYEGDQENNGGKLFGRCLKCNENGLIKCPSCSQ